VQGRRPVFTSDPSALRGRAEAADRWRYTSTAARHRTTLRTREGKKALSTRKKSPRKSRTRPAIGPNGREETGRQETGREKAREKKPEEKPSRQRCVIPPECAVKPIFFVRATRLLPRALLLPSAATAQSQPSGTVAITHAKIFTPRAIRSMTHSGHPRWKNCRRRASVDVPAGAQVIDRQRSAV